MKTQAVEVKNTKIKGRGIFALKNFANGEIVESCPIINISAKERKLVEKTIFNFYIYPWKSTRSGALALGYGSIYNHSFSPNADWKQNFRSRRMVYKALKPIKKGEEITVNYNGEPDDTNPIDWSDWKNG